MVLMQTLKKRVFLNPAQSQYATAAVATTNINKNINVYGTVIMAQLSQQFMDGWWMQNSRWPSYQAYWLWLWVHFKLHTAATNATMPALSATWQTWI